MIKSKPKKKQKVQNALTKKDIENFKTSDTIENLILLLLCYTGVRVQELCDLKWEDIDIEDEWITISSGKGNKYRQVPLLDYTKKILVKIKRKLKSKIWVLETNTGQQYYRQYINRYIKKLGDNLHPHLFRHTFATILHESGVDIVTLSTLLGHSSTRTTMDVYIHPRKEALKEAIKKLG